MKTAITLIITALTMISCGMDQGPTLPEIKVEVHFLNGKTDTLTIHERYYINRDNQLGTSKCHNCGYTAVANQVMYIKEL